MNILLVGNGKMATAIQTACEQRGVTCFRDIGAFSQNPQDETVAVHFGSGRQLIELVDCCQQFSLPLIQGSTKLSVTDYVREGVLIIEAPNISLQIVVLLQVLPLFIAALMKSGMDLSIIESHPAQKKDVSGTARAVLDELGMPHSLIQPVRDRGIQASVYDVPEQHLDGHAYHFFELRGPGNVEITVTVKVHGRETYADGVVAVAEKLCTLQGCSPYPMQHKLTGLLTQLFR